jgi:small-conductance mechanosensitive channel
MNFRTILTGMLIAGTSVSFAAEEQPDPAVAKLREALKNTMLQLRTEQGDKAALQANLAQSDAKVADLTKKLESLTKKSAEQEAALRKSLDDTTVKKDQAEGIIAKQKEALAKWKDGYEKAAALAQSKEDARARLADENSILKAKVNSYQGINLELYKIANDILDRYKNYSVGDALKAREPFTGITRARLETLVQDFKDKVEDHRIKPEVADKKKGQ